MLLWTGQTVSEMGSAVTSLALPLVAIVALRATVAEAAFLSGVGRLPFLLFALPAGVFVDRFSVKGVMITSNILRMLAISWIPVGHYIGVLSISQVFMVAFIMGMFTVSFDVAYQSYVPTLIDPRQFVDGNGKLGASSSLASIVGPSLCVGLVSLIGITEAMLADALSYVVSIASLLSIKSSACRKTDSGDSADGNGHDANAGRKFKARTISGLLNGVTAGLRFVFSDSIMRKIVICTSMGNVFFSMAISVEFIYLVRVLHVSPAETGLVVAISSIGGLIGGIGAGRLSRLIGSARVIYVAPLCFGSLGFLVPLAAQGWRVCFFVAGWFGLSFCVVTYNVAQLSYRQAICPRELLGRMNAALRWLAWGLSPLGAVLGGLIGSNAGVRDTLWLAMAGIWVSGLWVYFSPLRRFRDIPLFPQSP
jgi:MFS family permease